MNSKWYLKIPIRCCYLLFVLTTTLNVSYGEGLANGFGQFEFEDPLSNPQRPIKVWYYRPVNFQITGSVVFAMHGGNRNAERYLNTWKSHAEAGDYLLLCPEFSKEHYPDYRHYQLGFMTTPSGKFREKEKWAFFAIERIFDQVVEENQITTKNYSIYGHSGGGQFVHRLVLFFPEARFKIAIAGNPGWYTFLRDDVAYPYGLGGTKFGEQHLAKSLARRFVLLLGTSDTNYLGPDNSQSKIENPRQTPEAMRQGSNRFVRGKAFFKDSERRARELGVNCNWELQFAPGVGHENQKMSALAAQLIK